MDLRSHRDRVFAWPMAAVLTVSILLMRTQKSQHFRLSIIADESEESRRLVTNAFLDRHTRDWQTNCGAHRSTLSEEDVREFAHCTREICDQVSVGRKWHCVDRRTLRQQGGTSWAGTEE